MTKATEVKTGRSLDDFRAAHDPDYIVPKRIKDALTKLGDGWAYDQEFLKLSGLSTTQLATYRDQFEEFFIMTGGKSPKRIWAGTKGFAAKLREMAT